jgi:MFS family permease
VLLGLFAVRAVHSAHPLLDLGLFRDRVFSVSNAALFLYGAAFMGMVVFLPLFLVNVSGVSATGAGMAMIPLSMGVVAGSTVAGQLVARWGRYKPFMVGGGAALALGVFLLTTMDAGTRAGTVALYMVVCGLGIGPSMPLYTLAIQNAVDVRKLGQATSASQFFRQIGATAGAAAMGAVMALGLAHALGRAAGAVGPEGVPPGAGGAATTEAFAAALHPVFVIALVLAGLGWAVTLLLPELPLKRHFDHYPGRGSTVGAEQGQPEGVEVNDGAGRFVPPPVAH